MTELLWVPFAVLLLVFCAYVAEHWPRHDPTDDRRYQAHFRQARPTTPSGQNDLARVFGGRGVAETTSARLGSPDVLRAPGESSAVRPIAPRWAGVGSDDSPDVRRRTLASPGD